MCGIAGIVSNHEERELRKSLRLMVSAQSHRGPDDAGEVIVDFGRALLGLGHNRLSIQDISAAGHQPMIHPESGNLLIFNGEIYNFHTLRRDLESEGASFSGHSDTEVLLHALTHWGVNCLGKLEGMYAFAFFCKQSQQLTVARDPLGIKPLYLGRLDDGFAFASEVRALLASGLVNKRLDRRGLAGMLAYGAVQHPLTLFEDIRSFPPGCYQTFGSDGKSLSTAPIPFWSWPDARNAVPLGDDLLNAIYLTLDNTVKNHLISDVPAGVFLSSGIDSTVIAGLAARHATNLRSFTVGFIDQPDLCEFELAAETAKTFGLQHTEISITNAHAEASTLDWLDALDLPSVDGLNTFVISKAIKDRGITVALSGLGGDELFGGYPSFRDVPTLNRMLGPLSGLPKSVKQILGNLAMGRKPESLKQKFHDMLASDGSLLSLYLQRRRTHSTEQLASLGFHPVELGLSDHFVDETGIAGVRLDKNQPIWTISQLESRYYMGNMLLRDSDACSMAHGLEIRVPMLGQRMLDLMGGIPDKTRLPKGCPSKHLLRQAFPDLLRPEILIQPKKGFSLPIRRWMVGPLRDRCEASLSYLKSRHLLRQEGIDEVWQSFLAEPESPMWSRAFTLCVLGSYLQNIDRPR